MSRVLHLVREHDDQLTQETTEPTYREQLVLDHMALARKLAARYNGRGEPLEDLTQVAMLGLVKAADRFDPDHGTPFHSYAVPTVLGELRRYFRDHCWAVRIPRPEHDLYHRIQGARDRLSQHLQRSPTPNEIAQDLDTTEEEVLAALEAGSAYSAMSMDVPLGEDETGDTLANIIGSEDDRLEVVEKREAVRDFVASLPVRESRILHLWFYAERTQSQIARELGISQMHVSRLISSTLDRIRAAVDNNDNDIHWPKQRPRRHAS